MKQLTAEQLQKLPKWAQTYCDYLWRAKEDAETLLKDYLDNQSESLVWIEKGIGERSFLQTDRVTFKLPEGEIRIRIDDDHLDCNADSLTGGLRVFPRASNVLYIKV